MPLQSYGKILEDKLADFRALESSLAQEKRNLVECEDSLTNIEEAQKILQMIAEGIQREAHEKISNVVTRCLAAVFDNPYDFEIDFEQKRGKTEANLQFVRDGVRFINPMRQVGGGPIDVAAFALRLACLILQRPPLRPVLILDEPFRNIRGKAYRHRVRTLLETLSKEMGVQFILNVDADSYPEFLLGKIVELPV